MQTSQHRMTARLYAQWRHAVNVKYASVNNNNGQFQSLCFESSSDYALLVHQRQFDAFWLYSLSLF